MQEPIIKNCKIVIPLDVILGDCFITVTYNNILVRDVSTQIKSTLRKINNELNPNESLTIG